MLADSLGYRLTKLDHSDFGMTLVQCSGPKAGRLGYETNEEFPAFVGLRYLIKRFQRIHSECRAPFAWQHRLPGQLRCRQVGLARL